MPCSETRRALYRKAKAMTQYYRLHEGITSIRLETGKSGGHDRLTVFEHGGNAGTLVLTHGMGKTVAFMFADCRETPAPMTAYAGSAAPWRTDNKVVIWEAAWVTENIPGLRAEQTLVSEYGEVTTVEKVRAAGHDVREVKE